MTGGTHGTHSAYVRGCRCFQCRRASAAYRASRRQVPALMVPTATARKHLRELARQGVGLRQVGALTGVDPSVIVEIRAGHQARARKTTVDRLLACPARPAGGTCTTAWWTKRYIDALRGEGYSDAQIERWVGREPARLMKRQQTRLRTAQRAAHVYRELLASDVTLNG